MIKFNIIIKIIFNKKTISFLNKKRFILLVQKKKNYY